MQICALLDSLLDDETQQQILLHYILAFRKISRNWREKCFQLHHFLVIPNLDFDPLQQYDLLFFKEKICAHMNNLR
jgi:hypothetical protein